MKPQCGLVDENGTRICTKDAEYLEQVVDPASGPFYHVSCEEHQYARLDTSIGERAWYIGNAIDQYDRTRSCS